jgi:hypothetical protein
VIVTCSLTPATTNLFDRTKFELMKKSAVFVNTSRGGQGPVFVERSQGDQFVKKNAQNVTAQPIFVKINAQPSP